MAEVILIIVATIESAILTAMLLAKITDVVSDRQIAKEKEEKLQEKLLQQSESTQIYVESFWSLLRDLLSEIQDERQCQIEHPVHGCDQCQKADSEEE